jgi:amino acid transporter
MSEETHDAAIRGPVAIRMAVLVSGVVGWMLTITFCFCLSDYDEVLKSPTGMAAAQIFLNAGGRKGGSFMWFFVILIQFFTGCSAMLADTRMAYAFARDDALPFSGYVKFHVSSQAAASLRSDSASCIAIDSGVRLTPSLRRLLTPSGLLFFSAYVLTASALDLQRPY